MKTLYPEIEPFDTGRLKVSPVHEIYYEQCGNPNGKPAVFLHGGPGGGIVPDYRRYFDPEVYRLCCCLISAAPARTRPMQASKRTPPGISWQTSSACANISALNAGWCLADHGAAPCLWLIRRAHPDRNYRPGAAWHLSLQAQGDQVVLSGAQVGFSGCVGRGIFLNVIPEPERDDMVSAYYRRLISDDEEIKLKRLVPGASGKGVLQSCSSILPRLRSLRTRNLHSPSRASRYHYFSNT